MAQKFKVGDIVIAKKDSFMYREPNRQFLTKDKEYTIIEAPSYGEFKIIDDEKEPHLFDDKNYTNFFKLK